MILHNRISEKSYNVTLRIEEEWYVVQYGHQIETYEKTIKGLGQAVDEYKSCVDHAMRLEAAQK